MKSAPPFYLTAIGASRIVGGPPGPASPLLLLFHDHSGADTAFNINASLREHFPAIEQLQIASVVGLHHVPRFMRAAVELTLNTAYRHAAAAIPPARNPSEYVLIVPDWEGKVSMAYDMSNCQADVGLVLIVRPWQIIDTYRGDDPCSAALQMVMAANGRLQDSSIAPTTQS